MPLLESLYQRYLQWLDPGTNAFHTQRIKSGFIPIVSNVTMQMQSDAIEGTTVSTPGPGNGGVPTNSGTVPVTQNPPPGCTTTSCGSPVSEGSSGGGTGAAGPPDPGPVAPPESVPPTTPVGLEPGSPDDPGWTPVGTCEKAAAAV